MEQENVGLNVDTTATDVNEQTENEVQEEQSEKPSSKSFTQEQVNEIIKERLDRANNSLYKRYGVETKDGLDDLIKKANAYSQMDEAFSSLEQERNELREKLLFMENNINPDRYEDIRAYFKGKGLNFDSSNLANEITTHQEWLKQIPKQTTISSVGTNAGQVANTEESEKEIASRYFGLKLI